MTKLRKTPVLLAVFVFMSTLILTVNAETNSTPSTSQQSSNLIGEIIGVVGIIIIFSVIAYAGYKVIKKWSSQSD